MRVVSAFQRLDSNWRPRSVMTVEGIPKCAIQLASFPGSPPRAQLLRVTFEPVQRNRRESPFPDPSHLGKEGPTKWRRTGM